MLYGYISIFRCSGNFDIATILESLSQSLESENWLQARIENLALVREHGLSLGIRSDKNWENASLVIRKARKP